MHDLKKAQVKRTVKAKRGERNVRNKQRLNWKKLLTRLMRLILFLCCTIIVGTGVMMLIDAVIKSDHFRVATLQVNGNQLLSDKDVIDLSDIRLGVSTFDLDLEIIGSKLAENDWIHSARIMRKLPGGVVIDIRERKAVFIINLEYLYYVDGDGEIFKVLRSGDALDYPLVTGLDRQQLLNAPEVSQQQLKHVAHMLADLRQRKLFNEQRIAQINIDPQDGYVLYTDPFGVPLYVGKDSFSEKIDRLEHIFPEIEKRLSVLQYIDLNVADKVIVKSVSAL